MLFSKTDTEINRCIHGAKPTSLRKMGYSEITDDLALFHDILFSTYSSDDSCLEP